MIRALFLVALIGITSNLISLDFTIPFLPKTIEAADLDLDGDFDLVVGHYWNINSTGSVTISENHGSGNFLILHEFDLFAGAYILDIANLDDNPLLDIVISNEDGYDGDLRLCMIFNLDFENLHYINLGFNDAMVEHGTSGDFNNDGWIDLAFTTSQIEYVPGSYWGVVYGYGDQTFSQPYVDITPYEAILYEIESKDFNNDNLDDLAALGSTSYLFYSNIDGFDLEVLVNGYNNASMNSDDMDNDGDSDIIISKRAGTGVSTFYKYENINNEYFSEEIQFLIHPWGNHYAADLNGDLLPDLISLGHDHYTVYWNLGEMDFADAIEYPMIDYNEYSLEAAFADFDGNETIDMALIRYGIYENNLSILFNDGTGIMQPDPYVGTSQQEINGVNMILTNYPNPFNPITLIEYDLNNSIQNPVLLVFNIAGQIVDKISINKDQSSYIWDASNNPSGVYLYQIKAVNFESEVNKMVLMK